MWDFKPHCELPNYQRPHTQLMNPGGKYGVPAEDLGEQNTVSGSSIWGRSTCLFTSSSLWRQDSNQAKEARGGGRGDGTQHLTCWFGSLMFQTESRVSSSESSQFLEFPWKSDTHSAECGLLGISQVQHHTKNSELTLSS